MPKPRKKDTAPAYWDSSIQLLSWLATCVSVISFLFYYKSGDFLLYGDAVAHINIARRVFDSKTPGLLQLGTVWLPLPHLLMIPFLISNEMWHRGAGGSIPSMAAYVFAVVGIFRLTRNALSQTVEPDNPARVAAWAAALIFAANPNLIYLQSTAMGEVPYLAFFIWAVAFFADAARGNPKALTRCGLCLAGACLTRYDGWFLAAAMAGIVVLQVLLRKNSDSEGTLALSRASAIKFVLIAAAAPALWLAYNGIVYRNPLEFENGPYSAKAIEQRTQSANTPGHPGERNPLLAEMYFLKSGGDNVAENEWLQRAWLLIALAVVGAGFLTLRRASNTTLKVASWLPLLFLLIPLPFYALSIAYGGIPIFIPNWWPFSHYNVRYGLQLLPAFSVALAALVCIALRSNSWRRSLRFSCVFAPLVLAAASYASIWQAAPVCLREAQINMRTRTQLEMEVALWLEKLPPDSTILMYLGDHVGALERAGIPLNRTTNEGNHRVWKQPTDPDGLWERALANPAKYADYVVAFEGDPVWQAVHNLHLRELVEIHVTGQARAILYRGR
jgi:hypothetical protein